MAKRDPSNQVDPGTLCFTFMKLYEGEELILEGVLVNPDPKCAIDPNFKPGNEYWYSDKKGYTTKDKAQLKLTRRYADSTTRKPGDALYKRHESVGWDVATSPPDFKATYTKNGVTVSFGLSVKIPSDGSLPDISWFSSSAGSLFAGVNEDVDFDNDATMAKPAQWYFAK
jgi:hypothetical protein